MSAEYIAFNAISEGFKCSLANLNNRMETLGKLTHVDSKISLDAVIYFETQLSECRQAVKMIESLHKEAFVSMWRQTAIDCASNPA